jgi:hypothetical protein
MNIFKRIILALTITVGAAGASVALPDHASALSGCYSSYTAPYVVNGVTYRSAKAYCSASGQCWQASWYHEPSPGYFIRKYSQVRCGTGWTEFVGYLVNPVMPQYHLR